jgi:hypothetical protein
VNGRASAQKLLPFGVGPALNRPEPVEDWPYVTDIDRALAFFPHLILL